MCILRHPRKVPHQSRFNLYRSKATRSIEASSSNHGSRCRTITIDSPSASSLQGFVQVFRGIKLHADFRGRVGATSNGSTLN